MISIRLRMMLTFSLTVWTHSLIHSYRVCGICNYQNINKLVDMIVDTNSAFDSMLQISNQTKVIWYNI